VDIENHPTVKRHREAALHRGDLLPEQLDPEWVRKLVLESGADDVGVAPISSPVLDKYRQNILTLLPEAKTCISVICRMNPVNVRSPFRQLYELEYHHMYAEADHVARRAAMKLLDHNIAAVDCCSSYPMNMENWPGNGMWWVAHKPVAEAAGRGKMGLNHLLVHEHYGAFVVLATVLIDRELTGYDQPIRYDPCVKCMLCVTSCPVGALNADGHFNSIACTTHSYRLKYGGFTDWVESVVNSRNTADYRKRITDQETVLTWQALAVGTSYMCTNCMAVCPGGEDIIGPYADNPTFYRETVAKRLQDREETIYVVKGADPDGYVQKRFPHKSVKYVSNGVRAKTAGSFFDSLHIMFQRERSKGLDATYHFSLTGEEPLERTVRIVDRKLEVSPGLQGDPDVRVRADSRTWLQITAKERNPLSAMLAGKFRVSGPLRLFKAFVRCFPS
jgi:NAD-dependent dihydropyrimidine dehydrogenase PreA subunit